MLWLCLSIILAAVACSCCVYLSLPSHCTLSGSLSQFTELVQKLQNRVIGRMIKMYRDHLTKEPKVLADYKPFTVNAISDRMREIDSKLKFNPKTRLTSPMTPEEAQYVQTLDPGPAPPPTIGTRKHRGRPFGHPGR